MSEASDSNLYAPKSPDLSSFFSQPPAPRSPGTPLPSQSSLRKPQLLQHTYIPVSFEQTAAGPRHLPSQPSPQPPSLSIALPPQGCAQSGSQTGYRPPVTVASPSPYTPQQVHYQPPAQFPPHSHSGGAVPELVSTPFRSNFTTPLTPSRGQDFKNINTSHSQGYFPPQPALNLYPQQSTQTQEVYAPVTPHHSHPPQAQSYPDTRQAPSIPYTPSHQAYSAGGGGGGIPLSTPTNHPQSQSQPQSQSPEISGKMPPRKASQAAPPAPVIEPSPVRTKFPTARIKRIMQADEEVGKVAQQTPIAVGKALELFMISMVTKSAEVAKEKGQKRVTAQMLKQVVERDEQFDFLGDIVSKVEAREDSSSKSTSNTGKSKNETESEEEEYIEPPKRRGRGGGRKKKGQ